MEAASENPREWRRMAGPYQAVAFVLAGTYPALSLLNEDTPFSASVVIGLLCAAILVAVRSSELRRWNFITSCVLVTLIAIAVIGAIGHSETAITTVRVLFSLLTLMGVKATLTTVLRVSRVDTDKIFAAVCGLLLLGMFFGSVYQLIDQLDPNAISGHSPLADELEMGDRFLELSYFSFVTLTTLGYGDVVPVSSFARSIATLEAMVGQLYLAILVARLVALHIVHSRDEKTE